MANLPRKNRTQQRASAANGSRHGAYFSRIGALEGRELEPSLSGRLVGRIPQPQRAGPASHAARNNLGWRYGYGAGGSRQWPWRKRTSECGAAKRTRPSSKHGSEPCSGLLAQPGEVDVRALGPNLGIQRLPWPKEPPPDTGC